MKQSTKLLLLLIVVGTGIILGRLSGSSPANSQTQSKYETKEHEGGNVTVSVTPLTIKPGFPASFDVAFETHSVDLAFDVEQIATLTDSVGTVYTAYWEGSPPGGHHRSGTLRFTPDIDTLTSITLTFSDIANIPTRTFIWEENK
ncbi:hypothetical protein A3A79_02240 [Candidatus Gottesmanbacteria bacterium RIFCSPLOWO2_01_FULL_43_11b]|uniref:Uncharacterized protein n=1 Tax=Candidatus Gottesmanbacteria bacterium RIFCSPLOWO2_01_FULL_43_11b TaxID=1798392 RepID=A0A1F6AHY8_9BACT|nr:MAG: hypothetical protein A3A79_02240 [Candidatus Gottesmanbacteria bacterium RIFCSPLOWO2_01_FULL_43_11b]